MSAFDTSQTTTTSLPQWFTNAQNNIATQANNVYNATPAPGQTVGSQLVSQMTGSQNPFTQSENTLGALSTSNSQPFSADGTPNTSSPLGALFSSQNAQLNQMLPQLEAQTGAGGIGQGNYGSLRGQTAIDTAKAGALNTLATSQDQAALNAQTQATNAAIGQAQAGQAGNTAGINLANWQMNGGLAPLTNYSNIVNAMGTNADKTVNQTNNAGLVSNLQSAAGLGGSLLGGAAKVAGVSTGAATTGLGWLDNLLKTGNTSSPDIPVSDATGGLAPAQDTAMTAAIQNGYDYNPTDNTYTDPNTNSSYEWDPTTGEFKQK